MFDTSHMKNQYPTFSMDAVRGADLIQRHKAGLAPGMTCMKTKKKKKN